MAFADIHKFTFKNVTSGKIYSVALLKQTDGSVDGHAFLLGTNKVTSDPEIDNTEVSFVVLTSAVSKFNEHPTYLAQAAIFDASNPAGVGAALSTLLV